MIEIERSIVIERPLGAVFELVDTYSRYPEFFVGITRWESRSKKKRGVDALYRMLMKIGSIEAGGIVRVTARTRNKLIEWSSEQGIHQHGRWELAHVTDGTKLTLHVGFDLSGGPVGALVERVTGRIVARNMWATLLATRRILEVEQTTA